MDADQPPQGNPPLFSRGGPINFNMGTTFQSPFFWLLLGASAVIALQYMHKKQSSERRTIRNVTGTAE